MSAHPVALKTKYGIEQFNILVEQHIKHKANSNELEFRARCQEDFKIQNDYLVNFLDDDNMAKRYKMNDDSTGEGFKIFNEQSDICSCLIYFGQEWK